MNFLHTLSDFHAYCLHDFDIKKLDDARKKMGRSAHIMRKLPVAFIALASLSVSINIGEVMRATK